MVINNVYIFLTMFVTLWVVSAFISAVIKYATKRSMHGLLALSYYVVFTLACGAAYLTFLLEMSGWVITGLSIIALAFLGKMLNSMAQAE